MQQKKPLFLLEIVIAIFLVGLFSTYFLRSSIRCLYQERKALLELEFERQYDLKRMELLSNNWHQVSVLPKAEKEAKEEAFQFKVNIAGKEYFSTKKFKVFCPKNQDTAYLLVIKEDQKKYQFCVNSL
jgi:hypothetical protein